MRIQGNTLLLALLATACGSDTGSSGEEHASSSSGESTDTGSNAESDEGDDSESGSGDSDSSDEGSDEGAEETASGEPDGLDIDWVSFRPGSFEMGSTDDTEFHFQEPVHEVVIGYSFELMKTEATVAHYKSCFDAGICTEPIMDLAGGDSWGVEGREDFPINSIRWSQAVTFCEWIGGRLPSEAEWEYAAKDTKSDQRYPWGNSPEPSCDVAIIMEQSTVTPGCGEERPFAVGSRPEGDTEAGLWDMGGNVAEWVQDCLFDNYSGAPADGSAWETPDCEWRGIRGGHWYADVGAFYYTTTFRDGYKPEVGANSVVGVRCARDVKPGA